MASTPNNDFHDERQHSIYHLKTLMARIDEAGSKVRSTAKAVSKALEVHNAEATKYNQFIETTKKISPDDAALIAKAEAELTKSQLEQGLLVDEALQKAYKAVKDMCDIYDSSCGGCGRLFANDVTLASARIAAAKAKLPSKSADAASPADSAAGDAAKSAGDATSAAKSDAETSKSDDDTSDVRIMSLTLDDMKELLEMLTNALAPTVNPDHSADDKVHVAHFDAPLNRDLHIAVHKRESGESTLCIVSNSRESKRCEHEKDSTDPLKHCLCRRECLPLTKKTHANGDIVYSNDGTVSVFVDNDGNVLKVVGTRKDAPSVQFVSSSIKTMRWIPL